MACNVYQYLGERFTTSGLKVYYTEPDNLNYPDFDCSILSQALDLSFKTFKLTEAELLSCTSTNTWLSYCARAFGGGEDAGGETELLGTKVFEELAGEDWIEFAQNTLQAFENLIDHKAFGVSENFIKRQAPEVTAKLEIARNWLANIYNEYYGQKYLIQVGDSSLGICIKDRFGNVPQGTIKVDSEGGIFYSSDTPSTAGAWLPKFQNQVMGLTVGPELYPFTENDNRIGTFVKFNKTLGISKYNLVWDVDLGKLGEQNFYQKNNEELYVKASIDPSLYKIENKQYVLVTLDSPGELGLSPNSEECKHVLDSNGAIAIIALHGDQYIDPMRRAACDDPDGDHTGLMLEFSNLNIFEMNKPRITPDSFCLPFKSNVFVYGPWFFQANPIGGTEVEVNRELAPWNFSNMQNNGYDTMSYYGSLIAADGPRGLQKQESGSITVAALPSYGIGYIVGGNAATLTDIVINIGESGYTTTYNFQTYTPKFGRPGRHLSDLWTRNYKSMSYINRFFKQENLKIKALINQTNTEIQKQKGLRRDQRGASGDVVTTDSKTKGAGSQNTPNLFIYGGYRLKPRTYNDGGGLDYYDNSSSSPGPCHPCKPYLPQMSTPGPASTITPGNNIKNKHVVMTEDSLHNTWFKENHFERFALNSLDLLFAPISTNQEYDPDAELPRLAMYHSYSGSFIEYKEKSSTALGDGKAPNSKPRLEIPPFYFDDILQYDLPIHQMYLNSVTSTAMLNDWMARSNNSTDGFITNVISYGEKAIDFSIVDSDTNETNKQNQTNFRYNALRGPLTLQAWGYDTSGKPIPNAIDSAMHAERGKFRRHGLQDKFLKNWLSNPKTWPAGPIDLRWDRERGVWVSPPSNKIVVAKLLSNLEPYGVAEAELMDPQAGGIKFYEEYGIWSNDGANVKGSLHRAKIKVYDFLGIRLCKCDHIYAYYDDNRYIVLESNRAYKDPNEGCCATTTTGTVPTQTQPSQPTPTLATNCWCDLECLKTLKNFKEGKHQALVHKQETSGPDCLVWEDIVECYTPPPKL